MRRWIAALLAVAPAAIGARPLPADGPTTKPTTKPATVPAPPIVPPREKTPVAALLRRWYAEGTAAGNRGDYYDNRDGGHSRLNTRRFPQLRSVEYTEEQKRRRLHWAVQLRMLFDHVTIGNSSTASGDMRWGSNSRRCLLSRRAMGILYRQYRKNHLYVYPEHRDHDPGRNGRGGYGDLFWANTPYVITSQGSSGSDRAFLEAAAHTLAAFRPATKKLLVREGLLMPTVQMIFRMANKGIGSPDAYLTGKAHPSAFEGHNVNVLKMVEMAHAIKGDRVPPLVRLTVVDEDRAEAGRDYFEPQGPAGRRVSGFDTPCAIARIVRSVHYVRRMVVSARASFDANKRPLTYHWAVLRGDADRIRIRPLDDAGSEVELLVPYHARRPIRPGSAMESSRVDIGAFVHNGAYYSAPAFVCLYSLADEARTYDAKGRIIDVGYDCGDTTIGYAAKLVGARDPRYDIADWPALLELLEEDAKGLGGRLLRARFTAAERSALLSAGKELEAATAKEAGPKKAHDAAGAARKKAGAKLNEARKALAEAKKAHARAATQAAKAALDRAAAAVQAAETARKAADKAYRDARRKLDDARKAAHRVLTARREALDASVKQRLEAALNAIKNDPLFYFANAKAIEALIRSAEAKRRSAVLAERAALVGLDILKDEGDERFSLHSVSPGSQPAAERLTRYERNRVERFNLAILRELVYRGVLARSFRRNFVNPVLATPKSWRDVYRYAPNGRLLGWTRYRKGRKEQFTAGGALVVEKDSRGRALAARTVRYTIVRDRRGPRELKQELGDTVVHYEYASDADLVGRVVKTEKAAGS